MDWQTKEYIDSRLDEIEEKLDLLLEHLNIKNDSDIEDEELDELEEDSENVI